MTDRIAIAGAVHLWAERTQLTSQSHHSPQRTGPQVPALGLETVTRAGSVSSQSTSTVRSVRDYRLRHINPYNDE